MSLNLIPSCYRQLSPLTQSSSLGSLATNSRSLNLSSYGPNIKRHLITTPNSVTSKIDFKSKHITQIDPQFTDQGIPTNAKWLKPSSIKVVHSNKRYTSHTKTHYFAGGIPALMQAVYKIIEIGKNSPERVIYRNDGKISKSIQSGHQGHVHPSEWASDDCSIPNLVKTMLQGLGALKQINPNNLNAYSYLHFPLSWRDIIHDPIKFSKLYGGFFKQRIIHNLKSKNGVSQQDRWLCEGIRKSLEFHAHLSDKIEKATGFPTFKKSFRVYWSRDRAKLEKKKHIWKELNIPCEWMNEREVMEHTLLRLDQKIHVLKIIGDGNFYPETPQRIIEYIKKEFPNFEFKNAALTQLILNHKDEPSAVKEIDPQTDKESIIPISTFFCSPGHDEVYQVDPITNTEKKLWTETPVSGVSTLWKCTLNQEEIEQRFGISLCNENALTEISNKLVASANLTNLHITPLSIEISADKKAAILIIRGTQGANFNATSADPNDLENMIANINTCYIGVWELLSAGSCTRKTGISNVPEIVKGMFGACYSGIGYSASAIPPDMLIHP